MSKVNPSDLLNTDFSKKIKEDPRFKKYYDQLDDDQKTHVEGFISEIHSLFMPGVTKFYEGLNELSDEEREEFKKNMQQMSALNS
tara:strand:- start:347 stop:601 length:255 start_codon:yes stop_codon:yes gene_type:complete